MPTEHKVSRQESQRVIEEFRPITAMESQLAEIDRLAVKAGMTRSGYIVYRALDRPIDKRTSHKLRGVLI